MSSLRGTKTAENLLKAFAGESQARNRYTYYSSIAKKQGYVQISHIFIETAEQEKEHAKRFYKFLKDEFKGEAIEITAAYPVALSEETADNLRAAAAGENEEWTTLYKEFGEIAVKEGFPQIAGAFEMISEVEKQHEKRYLKLLENIETNSVFAKDQVELWKCDNCGYIYEGKIAPKVCPACLHPQEYFEIFKENY